MSSEGSQGDPSRLSAFSVSYSNLQDIIEKTGLGPDEVKTRLSGHGMKGTRLGGETLYIVDSRFKEIFPEYGNGHKANPEQPVKIPAKLPKLRAVSRAPIQRLDLINYANARKYVLEQIQSNVKCSPEAIGPMVNVFFWRLLGKDTGKIESKKYSRQLIEENLPDWIASCKRGREDKSAPITEAKSYGTSSEKNSESRRFQDYSSFPGSFKKVEDALEFVVYMLNQRGMDGEEFVAIDHAKDMSAIVEKSFSPETQGYRKDVIGIRVNSYLRNLTKTRRPRGRRRKNISGEIPLSGTQDPELEGLIARSRRGPRRRDEEDGTGERGEEPCLDPKDPDLGNLLELFGDEQPKLRIR